MIVFKEGERNILKEESDNSIFMDFTFYGPSLTEI